MWTVRFSAHELCLMRTCLSITDLIKILSWHSLAYFVLLTLDVSVYNHVAVQVGDSLKDLSGVSPRHLLRQGPVGF